MLRFRFLALTAFTFLAVTTVGAQVLKERVLYKIAGSDSLYADVIKPAGWKASDKRQAAIFFFGGGWNSGTNTQFEMQANYLAEKGMVCFLPDYRVFKRQKTSPIESLLDARSAMRYFRGHAGQLGINPNKIMASGGSAGGHLAAALEFTNAYDDATDDRSISVRPNLLVLFNPVVDNGPEGYGFNRLGEAYTKFSPAHNLHTGAPATLTMIGDADSTVPYPVVVKFQEAMLKLGNVSELEVYPGQGHGFFNREGMKQKTLERMAAFLVKYGYISSK